MRRKVFVHAGLHKTGTSSIQVELTRARHLLEERGYLYPRSGVPAWAPFGQHLLPWSLIRKPGLIPSIQGQTAEISDKDKDQLWDSLHEEIDAADLPNIIISSEEFDVLDRASIDELGKRLDRYDVEPVIFLRNFGDLIESSYRTAVLISHFSGTIERYLSGHRIRLDYAELLRDWATLSVSGKVAAVSYDDESLRSDSVLTFLRTIGLAADAIEPERLPKQNESAPAFVIEMIRNMRSFGATDSDLEDWLVALKDAPFGPAVNDRYAFLSRVALGELDSAYLLELKEIAADEVLAPQVYGRLTIPPRTDRSHISNIRDALNSLVQELSASKPKQES